MQILPTPDIVAALHAAYNATTGFDTQFNAVFERQFWDAAKLGLTVELFSLALKERLRGVRAGDRKPACLMPRNLIATDEAVNELLCEAHALMALKRLKVIDPARASVLRATGRPTEVPTAPAQASREVIAKLATEMRKAVGL